MADIIRYVHFDVRLCVPSHSAPQVSDPRRGLTVEALQGQRGLRCHRTVSLGTVRRLRTSGTRRVSGAITQTTVRKIDIYCLTHKLIARQKPFWVLNGSDWIGPIHWIGPTNFGP